MNRIVLVIATAILLGAGHGSPCLAQRNQQQPSVELSQHKVEGTITGLARGAIRLESDSIDIGVVLVNLNPQHLKRVTVRGDVDPSFLKPGLYVRFETKLDERGQATEPVEKMTLFSPTDGYSMGAFPSDPTDPTASYLVAGQLKGVDRRNRMLVNVGKGQVTAELGEEPKIDLEVADYTICQPGDKIKVTGYGQVPQQLLAVEIDVDLAEPLSGAKKRQRPSRASKEKRDTKQDDDESASP